MKDNQEDQSVESLFISFPNFSLYESTEFCKGCEHKGISCFSYLWTVWCEDHTSFPYQDTYASVG